MLKISILICFIVVCASKECQHFGDQDTFPPKVPFQKLNSTFVNRFDEIMVIGDVHGCFKELKMLLNKANVTGSNALKILTGDFMRKGPNSTEVLRFIRDTPSILSVRGNNDQKVLDRRQKADTSDYTLSGGDEFIKNLTKKDLDFLASLPYTISIPSLNAIIVHAGVSPGLPLEKHAPFDLMNIRNLIPDKKCPGGYRPDKGHKKGFPWASKWTGPEHIYFGHDRKRGLQQYPLATGIDTGAVYGDYLTGLFIKGPRKGQMVQQKALRQYFSHNPSVVLKALLEM